MPSFFLRTNEPFGPEFDIAGLVTSGGPMRETVNVAEITIKPAILLSHARKASSKVGER